MTGEETFLIASLATCGLGVMTLWVWALVDCLAHQPDRQGRFAWTLVILFGWWLGALAYLLVARRVRLQGEADAKDSRLRNDHLDARRRQRLEHRA